MTSERRYSDKEIAKIFKQASKAQEEAQSRLTQNEGLTLEELQQIGNEAGITPEFIEQAAGAMDRPADLAKTEPSRQTLGITYSVGRVVELPDHFGDDHWEMLVVDLRRTFQAHGKVQRHGSLREWSNGNLHVTVEPSRTGKRLRLTTRKGSARGLINGGIAYAIVGLLGLLVLSFVAVPDPAPLFVLAGLVSVVGFGMVGGAALTVPNWARTRQQQMDELASRAVALAGVAPESAARPEATAQLPEAEPLLDAARAESEMGADSFAEEADDRARSVPRDRARG